MSRQFGTSAKCQKDTTLRHWCRTVRTLRHQSDSAEMSWVRSVLTTCERYGDPEVKGQWRQERGIRSLVAYPHCQFCHVRILPITSADNIRSTSPHFTTSKNRTSANPHFTGARTAVSRTCYWKYKCIYIIKQVTYYLYCYSVIKTRKNRILHKY